MKSGQKRISSLEVGRGFAATLVVLHHAGAIVEQPRFYGETGFGGLLAYFYVGVDFFFVLSGFIIAWVHWDDLGDRAKLGTYATKRFLRIYPPYWGVLAILLLLYAAMPGTGLDTQRDPLNIVLSFLLLPSPMPPVLGVAWTLVHEIFFYAIFALVILVGRRGLWAMPLWALAIVLGQMVGPKPFLVEFVLSPYNLQFILGVGAAILLRRHTIARPALVAAIGVVGFLSFLLLPALLPQNVLLTRLIFGLSAALFVVGMVEIEWHRPLRLAPALVFFGGASYAVYLVHPLASSTTLQILFRLTGRTLPVDVTILLITAAGVMAGMLYFALIEKRLTRLVRLVLSSLGVIADKPHVAAKRLP